MKREGLVVASFLLFTLLTVEPVFGVFYPDSYIKEDVEFKQHSNGTLISEEREGSVEVLTKDVLQDVDLVLSKKGETNLQSEEAYRPTISSPEDIPTKLYLNTTDSDKALNYEIDESVTPEIRTEFDYRNAKGGKELHSGKNRLNFTVRINTSEDLSESQSFEFIAPQNTTPDDKDSIHFTGANASHGHVLPDDLDENGVNERVLWSGDFPASEILVINFTGTTEPGVNFPEENTQLNLDNGRCLALHESSDTYTDITFFSRMAKDSARNGVYLTHYDDDWYVKGFFKNKAEHLRYKIDGWSLYRVGEDTPLLSNSTEIHLDPGETKYTDEMKTDKSQKQYFMTSFDWEVVWGNSLYSGKTRSSVELPTVNMIDGNLDKTLTLTENNENGREVVVQDKIKHLGDEDVMVNRTTITSEIPHPEEGTTDWEITGAEVFFGNHIGGDHDEFDVTADTNISVTPIDENGSGRIRVRLDMENVTEEEYIENNDYVLLKYKIKSTPSEEDQAFFFGSNSTMTTDSGTVDIQYTEENLTIPDLEEEEEEPSTGGGGAGTREPSHVDLEPIRSGSSVVTGNKVQVMRSDQILDNRGKGLRKINPQILLPVGGELLENTFQISYSEQGEWKNLSESSYQIAKMGNVTVGDKKYHLYDIPINESEFQGLTLHNDDKINISYEAKVHFGSNTIITRISGYNYYEDRFFHDDASTNVRVGWELESLDVIRKNWEQQEAVVKEPVLWKRNITVRNPNKVPVKKTLTVYLPDDSFSCYMENESLDLKERSGNKYVDWRVQMEPQEEKTFVFKAYTSPIMLSRENIKILESRETLVRFELNNTFHNYAPHVYKNTYRILPIRTEKIKSIQADGKNLSYSKMGNKTKVDLGRFFRNQDKSITVVYKETPPTIVMNSDAFNYTERGKANITVLVVGKEDQTTGFVELVVEGPAPENRTVYSDIIELAGEREKEVTKTIDISSLPGGKYSARAGFRKDFENIEAETIDFWIGRKESFFAIEDWYIVAILVLIVIGILPRVYRRKEHYEEKMKELRKKMKKSFK